MMQRAEDIINTAINEIRELSKSLIQVYQREIGLQLSIENLVESIRIGNRFTISIDFALRDENQLVDQLKMTLFRIIQEQLNNILTHAQPKNISISLRQSGKVVSLCVEDDGKGFDVQHKRMGIGITNIINRAEIFNGQVNIQSSPGNGCRLQVSFSM
ncbi:sensor histidine kinase [Paraflavitalea speifideaquila]|uniref:sensor histidine kinase n=1 Tax=Paraflavitalea speifideaquila TaxID=3076558 RepID=UPI0028E2C303|nr:ATP-binding protein [Paraflavitalea speifideiaquila]